MQPVTGSSLGMRPEELSAAIEVNEAAFWHSWLNGLAPAVRERHGLAARSFGSAVALSCREEARSQWFNRVVGLGMAEPADDDLMSTILTHYVEQGVPCRVALSPYARPAGLADRLLALGFRYAGDTAVLYLQTGSVPLPAVSARGLHVEPVTAAEADLFAEIYRMGFESPPVVADMARGAVGIAGVDAYLAYVDDEPAGAALLYSKDGVANLAGSSVVPRHRGQGIQSALIVRRVADAARAGCGLIATATLADSVGHQNLTRLDFKLLYLRPHYVQVQA